MICRSCRCSDERACFDVHLGPCEWYAPELCSFCVILQALKERVFELVAPEPWERALSYGGIVLR
jgi:hypothetical protein